MGAYTKKNFLFQYIEGQLSKNAIQQRDRLLILYNMLDEILSLIDQNIHFGEFEKVERTLRSINQEELCTQMTLAEFKTYCDRLQLREGDMVSIKSAMKKTLNAIAEQIDT